MAHWRSLDFGASLGLGHWSLVIGCFSACNPVTNLDCQRTASPEWSRRSFSAGGRMSAPKQQHPALCAMPVVRARPYRRYADTPFRRDFLSGADTLAHAAALSKNNCPNNYGRKWRDTGSSVTQISKNVTISKTDPLATRLQHEKRRVCVNSED